MKLYVQKITKDDKNEWPKICKATSNVTCKQGRCDCPEIKSGI